MVLAVRVYVMMERAHVDTFELALMVGAGDDEGGGGGPPLRDDGELPCFGCTAPLKYQ